MGFMSYREPATGSFSCILWYTKNAGASTSSSAPASFVFLPAIWFGQSLTCAPLFLCSSRRHKCDKQMLLMTGFTSGRLYALFAVMERALLNMALSRLSAMSFLPLNLVQAEFCCKFFKFRQ